MLLCCAGSTAPTVEQCEAADLLQAWCHPCKQRESASLSETGESVVKCKSFCLGVRLKPVLWIDKSSGALAHMPKWEACAASGGMHCMESSSIKDAL